MATIIRIKRSTGSIAPASLKTAEMAYTYGIGTTGNMGERLFIGTGDDGSANATYVYDEGAGTITLNGTGAFLGIPKAYNGGECTSPDDAPASITYDIELSENNTVMIVDISIGSGWWRYKLVKN